MTKERLLRSLKLTLIIYFVTYIVSVYYQWDFFIPLTWVADVPLWTGWQRIGLVLYLLLSCPGTYLLANRKEFFRLAMERHEKKTDAEEKRFPPKMEDYVMGGVVFWIFALCMLPVIICPLTCNC